MQRRILIGCSLLFLAPPFDASANTDNVGGTLEKTATNETITAARKLEYGLQLGPDFTTHGGKDAENAVVQATNAIRFVAGGFVLVQMFRWLSLQPELLLAMKGTDFEVDGRSGPAVRTSYLELPLLIRAQAPWKTNLPSNLQGTAFMFGGPWFSLLVSAKARSSTGQLGDVKDAFKPFDFGLTLGAGVAVEPVWWGAVELSARYDLGLQRLDDTGQGQDVKNRTISIMLGFRCCAHKPPARRASEAEPVDGATPDATSTESKPGGEPAPNELPDSP